MRWLTTPLQSDGDVVAASSRLRAWANALGLDAIARARVVTLGGELARAAASSGDGCFELGWSDESETAWCAIEASASALDAASNEVGDAGLHLHDLDVVRSHDTGRARVRIDARPRGARDARPRGDRETVERAVVEAAQASVLDVLRAQNLEMARLLDTLRDREAELARANELLTIASHDIRSPLAAAKGALDLVEPTLAELTDDQRHLFAVARRGCDAAVHLVANLMSTAIVELPDGELEEEHGSFDLAASTREVIELMAVPARQKGVEIHLDAPPSTSPVRGDPTWARQIIANLVNNALKYAPRKGGRIDVHVEARAGEIRFTIDDDGVGIAPEQIARVFEKLARLRPRGTAGERGTGIGLYVTKKLVERLGGSIAVHARDGGGARFEVTLPVASSDLRAAASTTTEPAQRL